MSIEIIERKDIPPKLFEVCDLIAEGNSANKGCELAGISTATFFKTLRDSEFLEKQYVRARESRADWRFEKLQDLLDDVVTKKIEPNAARVILDAIKWQCGKEKAKVYGDATILRGDKDNPIELGLANLLDAAAVKRQQIQAPIDIEGECIEIPNPVIKNDVSDLI